MVLGWGSCLSGSLDDANKFVHRIHCEDLITNPRDVFDLLLVTDGLLDLHFSTSNKAVARRERHGQINEPRRLLDTAYKGVITSPDKPTTVLEVTWACSKTSCNDFLQVQENISTHETISNPSKPANPCTIINIPNPSRSSIHHPKSSPPL